LMSTEKNIVDPAIVLLVEDNMDHAELIKRSFADQEIKSRIYHVTDGEAALHYLFRRGKYSDPESSPRPRIILLDLRLPKITGLEVLKEIKDHTHNEGIQRIPIIILSTSGAETDAVQAYEKYANSYLIKPGDFGELNAMINSLCNYWLNWNYYVW